MKQTQKLVIIFAKGLFCAIMHFVLISQLSSCFLKQDRTTTVYGTITDQNGQPVDSILVMVSGVDFNLQTTLKEVYSDNKGNYEVVVDVPKKYTTANCIIPALPITNPKFQRLFSGYDVLKNDKPTSTCCTATTGQKTKYDFQLIPK